MDTTGRSGGPEAETRCCHARELADRGTALEAACRIIVLEDRLEEAQCVNAEYRRATGSAEPPAVE